LRFGSGGAESEEDAEIVAVFGRHKHFFMTGMEEKYATAARFLFRGHAPLFDLYGMFSELLSLFPKLERRNT